jgi:hypothetical protein
MQATINRCYIVWPTPISTAARNRRLGGEHALVDDPAAAELALDHAGAAGAVAVAVAVSRCSC